MRQIVLDTETTGLDPAQGHKIIEIGCVELLNRKLTGRHLHVYINPEREVEAGALEVHGITNEFLDDKPLFSAIAESFMEFVKGAELVIHNAPFDIGFLNAELKTLNQGYETMQDYCPVLDTLAMARKKHPGQKNNLDALCKRYDVDNSQRELHGALKDAEILADVYLMMTGGQSSLVLGYEQTEEDDTNSEPVLFDTNRPQLRIIAPTDEEEREHQSRLAGLHKSSGQQCLWLLQQEARDESVETSTTSPQSEH